MRFTWDPRKADRNLRKHRVAFDDALHSEEERREIIIGTSAIHRIILVCFVEKAEETIRIISARRATKNEIKDYEENARFQAP